ncbi:hypothetical protein cypCar_00024323 [Cyprinus carpio]|nr:hypothetical protein cypCar_00024323 [Cyprinus carpio]
MFVDEIFPRHFVIRGPEKTPYKGGYYHGKLIFPQEFPFKPPGIYMLTPNGRFMCNRRLCLSISDFHPDTWNPAWSVSTILTALLSFMKRQLSLQSLAFNLKDRVVCELFPEVVEEIKVKQRTQKDFGVPPHTGHVPRRKPNLRGALANLCVIAGLVVCVYTVKFVCYIIQARTENRPESSF